jgi:hypothetical protein
MRVFVSVEGKVSIQYVGEISVSGISIEAATQKMRLCPKYIVLLGQGNSSCCKSESHKNDSSNYNRKQTTR